MCLKKTSTKDERDDVYVCRHKKERINIREMERVYTRENRQFARLQRFNFMSSQVSRDIKTRDGTYTLGIEIEKKGRKERWTRFIDMEIRQRDM